jgi:hypothetical protein
VSRAERSRALVVAALLVVAVAVPGLRMLADPGAGDGFPLSTFPMFAEDHGRTLELPTVVAVTDEGVERLSPHAIAGTDQVVQAWETVRTTLAAGPDAVQQLCEEVAGRTDVPGRLAVVVERYDTVAWAADPTAEPLDRRTLARCRSDR